MVCNTTIKTAVDNESEDDDMPEPVIEDSDNELSEDVETLFA